MFIGTYCTIVLSKNELRYVVHRVFCTDGAKLQIGKDTKLYFMSKVYIALEQLAMSAIQIRAVNQSKLNTSTFTYMIGT